MRVLVPLFTAILALAAVLSATGLSSAEPGEPATGSADAGTGDVDCDGDVDAIDAALVLQLIADLFGPLACPEAGDANLDGETDSVDAALILQFIAGLIDELPVGGPKDTATPTNTSIPPTSTPSGPTATNTPDGPIPTETPDTDTGTLIIRKEILDGETVVEDSAPGWEIRIYFGEDCVGSPFLTTSTGTSPLMIGLSAGDYSVQEVMQGGYMAVSETCINVEDLDAGEEIEVVFQNEEV